MNGIVDSQRLAIVRVAFCHPQTPYRQELDAMIDTGCQVEVVLSRLDIAALGLSYTHTQVIQFADGRSNSVDVYDGVIEWFGQRRAIEIYQSSRGMPLLGARLLKPRTLVVDYGKGTVEIR